MSTDAATRTSPQASTNDDNLLDQVLAQDVNKEALLQIRMEHQSIMAECRVRPRDFGKVLAELEERIKLVPELAVAGIYSKPIGTVFEVICTCGNRYECGISWGGGRKSIRQEECERCGKWAPKSTREMKKKARNLSVRMAEEIAEVYGYNRVHSAMSIIDPLHVKITASFFDYQKLRSWISESIVSKTYTTKGRAGAQVIPDDRFWSTVVKAEASKTIRESILRSVPAGLKLRAFAICEKIASESLRDDEIDKIVSAFGGKGVGLDRLERHIGRTRREGWTKADRLELAEAWNAIKENEATIDELFGEEEPADQSPKTPPTGATMEDLAGKNKPAAEQTRTTEQQQAPRADDAPTEATGLEQWDADLTIADSIGAVHALRDRADRELQGDQLATVRRWCEAKEAQIHAGRGERSNGNSNGEKPQPPQQPNPAEEAEAILYWEPRLKTAPTQIAWDNLLKQAMADPRIGAEGKRVLPQVKRGGKGGQKSFT